MYDTTECKIRQELAACYRLAAYYGWDDLLATHISARLPGEEEAFLINPFGLLFEEITASNLIKIDMNGNLLESSDYGVNVAGFAVHSAVHQGRSDAGCVMHLHTRDGVAVSMTENGVLPLNQTAMLFYDDIAYHEFEGVADLDERVRLQEDLGTRNFMVLRNHGTLTVGQSIGAAFYRMYLLEWVCSVQVRAMGMNTSIHDASQAAIEKVAGQVPPPLAEQFAADLVWPALLRKALRLFPDLVD